MNLSDSFQDENIKTEKFIKYYFDLIKKLKLKEIDIKSIDLEEHKPGLNLTEIIESMESINSKICEFLVIPKVPITQHLEYFMSKDKSYDDPKYERLFDISTSNAGSKDSKLGSKLLDYSIKDKLIGFLAKNGNPAWSEDKISEFINSIKNSNSKS